MLRIVKELGVIDVILCSLIVPARRVLVALILTAGITGLLGGTTEKVPIPMITPPLEKANGAKTDMGGVSPD